MEPTAPFLQTNNIRRNALRIAISFGILLVGFFVYLNMSPSRFPVGDIVTVKSGESLSSVAKDLKDRHIIRSTFLFKAIEVIFAGENKLIAGDYYFKNPLSTYSVALRIMRGNFDLTPVKVTIPEGSSMKQVATILASNIKNFPVKDFMTYYPAKEGYLFPDTYFFMPNVKVETVIETMEKNFNEKVATLQDKINIFGKSKDDVIKMASILEEEAKTPEDWKIISGILWKRIKIGMPLQVDATQSFGPDYDTYNHKGLPTTPISSPGIATIEAAVTPTATKYFYYLSDKSGDIYYAATFDEHILNKQKYLNK